MSKDWTGNSHSIYATLGASNHTTSERAEHDFYATDPAATEWLCKLEKFEHTIWEPACGQGHISEVLKKHGYDVVSTDIVDRGYGYEDPPVDFLKMEGPLGFPYDIITNPPYSLAQEFVEHALDILRPWEKSKVAMFLKLTFLEGKKRRQLFDKRPPCRVWVSSSRLKCAKNGDFDSISSSAAAYGWFVWEIGNYSQTVVKWFN